MTDPSLLHLLIPQYWITVEERRRPDLKGRPVIIASSFLEKSAAHSTVLMADTVAQSFGVTTGMGLAQARHLCPEAVILSPELDLYRGIWDEVLALLLTYTPLVQSLGPGEAVCDVTGSRRLFGNPVDLAGEIVDRLEAVTGLQSVVGVGSSRLVAELSCRGLAEGFSVGQGQRVAVVEPGREARFLARLPVSMLPGIDAGTLLTFQVLGLKTVGHLASLSVSSLERRFGSQGRRLGEFARGRDDRIVSPAPEEPAVKVSARCDGDEADWMGPEQALTHVAESLAMELSDRLRERYLAGRLLVSTVKAPRALPGRGSSLRNDCPAPVEMRVLDWDDEQWFPSQEARIHSMLPQPKREGASYLGVRKSDLLSTSDRPCADLEKPQGWSAKPEAQSVIRAMGRIETRRPINDGKTLIELANTLLHRMYPALASQAASGPCIEAGMELQLEMRHFAPPEQLRLPVVDSLMGSAKDNPRVEQLVRQEEILRSRFGSTPFRHLAAVDPESVLEERRFKWGEGIK
jgi:DNA polymerase IV